MDFVYFLQLITEKKIIWDHQIIRTIVTRISPAATFKFQVTHRISDSDLLFIVNEMFMDEVKSCTLLQLYTSQKFHSLKVAASCGVGQTPD